MLSINSSTDALYKQKGKYDRVNSMKMAEDKLKVVQSHLKRLEGSKVSSTGCTGLEKLATNYSDHVVGGEEREEKWRQSVFFFFFFFFFSSSSSSSLLALCHSPCLLFVILCVLCRAIALLSLERP